MPESQVGDLFEGEVRIPLASKIDRFEANREGVVDALNPAPVMGSEGRALDLVAANDLREGLLERLDVEGPLEPDERLELVWEGIRLELVEEAGLGLGVRGEEWRAPGATRDR